MSTELAWAAGFFEADGCVTWNVSSNVRKTGNAKTYSQVKLNIGQVGHDVPAALLRVQAVLGGTIGGPYGPYKRSNNKTPAWHLNITGKQAHRAMHMLSPYLMENGPKLAKYRELLSLEGGRA